MLSREQELDLTGIRWHWQTAYTVDLDDDGVWTAVPHVAPSDVLTADTADELRTLIRADYFKRTGTRPAPLLQDRMST